MEMTLINGRFEGKSAVKLLEALAAVKINYHQERILSEAQSEEDIKASENKIKTIERELRQAVEFCNAPGNNKIDLMAKVEMMLYLS